MPNHHSKPGYRSLRKGRASRHEQVYLLTWRTFARKPTFENLRASRVVISCMRYADFKGWTETLAFVVMPDHVHWCIQLGRSKSLSKIIYSVKRFSSGRLATAGLAKAPVWQAGYHDRAIRTEESIIDVSRYVVANPLRAGLASDIGDYPHWDAVWLAHSEV